LFSFLLFIFSLISIQCRSYVDSYVILHIQMFHLFLTTMLSHLSLCVLLLASTLLLLRKYGYLIVSTALSTTGGRQGTPNDTATKPSVDGVTGVKHRCDLPPPRTEYIEGSAGVTRTRNLLTPLKCGASKLPTGLGSDDISRLGDFPDYARLSGISLPRPDVSFDINKSLCRPYRPFRWPHHQTMSE
jgi:hypothetical protein